MMPSNHQILDYHRECTSTISSRRDRNRQIEQAENLMIHRFINKSHSDRAADSERLRKKQPVDDSRLQRKYWKLDGTPAYVLREIERLQTLYAARKGAAVLQIKFHCEDYLEIIGFRGLWDTETVAELPRVDSDGEMMAFAGPWIQLAYKWTLYCGTYERNYSYCWIPLDPSILDDLDLGLMSEGPGHVAPTQGATQPPSPPISDPMGSIDIQEHFDLPTHASNPLKRAPVEVSDSLAKPLDCERPAKRRRLSIQSPGDIAPTPSPETKTPELSAGEECTSTDGSEGNVMLAPGEENPAPASPSNDHLVPLFIPSGLYKPKDSHHHRHHYH